MKSLIRKKFIYNISMNMKIKIKEQNLRMIGKNLRKFHMILNS